MTVKLFTLLVFLLLTGCSLLPHFLYKIDVQQGNVVTEEMVEKLRPDMTKSQVRFVMGSPLVVDPFRNNRWDYAYIERIKGDLAQQTRLTVYFEDDRLIRIEKQDIYTRNKKKKNIDSQSKLPEEETSELSETSEDQSEK
ncbi:MAG: outer membrane protein assembly factor BamE [Nitrosomonas sp.]|nr:outer membrane protein assembly factor BamE [Nitrosomonas sp.]